MWREGLWCKMMHYGIKKFANVCVVLYSGVETMVVMKLSKVKMVWC